MKETTNFNYKKKSFNNPIKRKQNSFIKYVKLTEESI